MGRRGIGGRKAEQSAFSSFMALKAVFLKNHSINSMNSLF